ncbi:CPBP family intramembrane glutamic endopeptidase ['Paenibacillus yunnanensis' Narsing Rao et al. 2020]|uniref:CPBP family intramembrane glutamic endopeptidase n=1 Tax=Paenibacillus tengchongensis TaxID=2608684 RepID=UPI00124ECAA9|nr:type II CAAX endopeptidase family protein [Paenibacillus tengchongensis]
MFVMIRRFVGSSYVLFYIFLLLIGAATLFLKSPLLQTLLIVLSSWSSTIVLIVMFRRIYPQRNLWSFIKSRFSGKISGSALGGVVLLQLLILAGSLWITSAVWDVPVDKQVAFSWLNLLLLFGYNLIQGPLGEELGWRGFVLNELQKKLSPLKSAVVVGLVWGLWHAPLWLMSGYTGYQLLQYVISFLAGILAVSVIITAFYNRSRNLIIPIIIHQLFNFNIAVQTGDVLRKLTLTAVLYLFAAVILVAVNPEMCRQPNNKTPGRISPPGAL